jgi:hypothetical protein
MGASAPSVSDLYAQMLRDAFATLDAYRIAIANRDPVKSLNEDRCELLRRVRAALAPLILDGDIRRDDVAEVAQRIDDFLAAECPVAPAAVPRMYPLPIERSSVVSQWHPPRRSA